MSTASTEPPVPVLQMASITKVFGDGILANDGASLAVWEGEMHAVIGENGAGKSTLMNVLFGRVQPDRGRIRLRGEDVRIDSPARAIAMGLGMVTQHTTLIPALTTLENVILGAEPTRAGVVDRAEARRRVEEIAERLDVRLDWNAPAETLSVAALQKAEIVKALYRGARILILDEPTATLAPQEAEALFGLLHTLTATGATVIFITHKLREVMAHSRRVTVLRAGKTVGERLTSETTAHDLMVMMLGAQNLAPEAPVRLTGDMDPDVVPPWVGRPSSEAPPVPILEVRGVRVLDDRGAPAVQGVSLTVAPGEVLGVAGVDGSGQRELAEAVIGLRPLAAGAISLEGHDIGRWPVARRLRAGMSYIPEDRHRDGLVMDFTLAENLLLGRERDPHHGGGTIFSPRVVDELGQAAIVEHRIRAGGPDVPARTLSGGNQQKLVLARALQGRPGLLVAMQPTRGLDAEATRTVYARLRDGQRKGMGVLLFSLDLDEIFEISDRIAVMYNGTLAGILPRAEANADQVGRMMLTGQASAEARP